MAKKYENPGGFPEHLPQVLAEEMRIKDIMRKIYESFGYVPLETPSVENMDTLASKGEIRNEVYGITRALAEGDKEEPSRGLRFDLTVPFARYVAQHYAELSFPFKRWQIQKVWRGDRPQAGRFREFYQADIDVIGNGSLPVHFDAEVVTMVDKVLDEIGFGKFTISINHRKLLQGLLEGFGITDEIGADEESSLTKALRIIDKYDKVGRIETKKNLIQIGVDDKRVEELMAVLEQQIPVEGLEEYLESIPGSGEIFQQGVEELKEVAKLISGEDRTGNGRVVFNPRIARGLDYYTGSVYETTIDGFEKYGSICSGGRYQNLAGKFTNRELPGVGISIGLSRLMYILEHEKLIEMSKQGVTDVVVGLLGEHQRVGANSIAAVLRGEGINTEVAHSGNLNLAKQFKYADKIGARHMVLMNEGGSDDGTLTVKNLKQRTEALVSNTSELVKKILEEINE